MASYLLKTPDEDMERWKRVAHERGMSFAEFCRQALEALSGAPAPKTPIRHDQIHLSGKKSFQPDPK